jgi:hypothetical protein
MEGKSKSKLQPGEMGYLEDKGIEATWTSSDEREDGKFDDERGTNYPANIPGLPVYAETHQFPYGVFTERQTPKNLWKEFSLSELQVHVSCLWSTKEISQCYRTVLARKRHTYPETQSMVASYLHRRTIP